MGILDNNRWEDEDKAMQAILNGTDAHVDEFGNSDADYSALDHEISDEELAQANAEAEAHEQAYREEIAAMEAEQERSAELEAHLRVALGLPDEHPITQEAYDAFLQLTNPNDLMRNAMLAFKELGDKPAVVAAVFCAMGAEVNDRIFGWMAASDCFCRIAKDDVAPANMGFWEYDPKIVRFIYDAVKEKIAREEMPETLTHTSTVQGQRLNITLRRIGAKDYEVDDVSISPVEPF